MERTPLIAAATLCALAIVAYALAQPSLTPPAGPVDETGRFGTLIELSQDTAPGDAHALFVVTQPGSYFLTGNTDAGALDGIHVAVDDVTIDLNGYTLSGAGASGITVPEPTLPDFRATSLTVRNGVVRGFGIGFRDLRTLRPPGQTTRRSDVLGVRLEGLHMGDVSTGIIVANGGVVASCVVEASTLGIEANFATVRDCFVRVLGTGQTTGIRSAAGTVNACSVRVETMDAAGAIAFDINAGLVTACSSVGLGTGFDVSSGGIANGCLANNSIDGVVSGGAQSIDSNF